MGLLESLTPTAAKALGYTKTPAAGTGIKPFIDWATAQGLVTDATISAVIPDLPPIFGGYPYTDPTIEKALCGLFIALFGLYAICFTYVFVRNLASGQNFFPYIGVIFYCLMKVVGFACRYAWSRDILNIPVAIVSVVFIQVASLILEAMNQILGHRIFTWRHPETGNSVWMVSILNALYFVVIPVIVMAILGEALPYLYFYTEDRYNTLKRVAEAAGVLNLLYAAFPFLHLGAAILFKPGQLSAHPWKKRDGSLALPPVFQPSWIQSASPFYFVKRGEQGVIYKEESAASAIRIIASREPPAAGLHNSHSSEPMHPNSPRFSVAYITAAVSTSALVLLTVFRCISTFEHGTYATAASLTSTTYTVNYWPTRPYVMYIFYGGVEALVCAWYLIMRVDLRFYIPDRVSKSRGDGDFAERKVEEEFSSGTH